ncbi:GNAT family N-acetyltransferase [Turneriella parva]|uniref:GCN5-related N-acetyltransferase n=1 Tax=Turneriella parva (strain ATCC BAA-1111 / DSM 21527 / NCTC 11395 / H) TaxID=869212 RepID=I4B5W0_TURPD|nr:GNAT family N-acetyltransferase [Turneriella parva]AFM12667.1 GCN5-related N-acetyltransferase [Turneriella parva DSM 21527]
MSFSRIETERLILRTWRREDLNDFAEMNADLEVMRFFPTTLTSEESNILFDKIVGHFEEKGFGLFALETRETQEFIGFTGLSTITFQAPFSEIIELGWRIIRKYQCRGYATEAANAAKNYAFHKLGFKSLVAFTVPENVASRRVMEKIGMIRNPDEDFDHPRVPQQHPLRRHVLYRVKAS